MATDVVVVAVVASAKAFSFHNRSLFNFACRLKTVFSTIVPCRIFKLRKFSRGVARNLFWGGIKVFGEV